LARRPYLSSSGSQKKSIIMLKIPKIRSKIYFLCGDKESVDMVTDVNRMVNTYLIPNVIVAILMKKIVKEGNIMKNFGAMAL
jgi:hypothetical protein